MSAVGMRLVGCEELASFAFEAFLAMGLKEEDARMTAGALLYSELRFHPGQGQGVRRLRAYQQRIGAGLIDPGRRLMW